MNGKKYLATRPHASFIGTFLKKKKYIYIFSIVDLYFSEKFRGLAVINK